MLPADHVSSFVYEEYVVPALASGENRVAIGVREVWKALDCAYSPGFIRGVLGSMKFRNAYHLSLVREPVEGLAPEYTFRISTAKLVSSSR